MSSGEVLLGDWGTTRLRLWLVRDGEVVAEAKGPGIGVSYASPKAVFAEAASQLPAAPDAPVLLAGMIGSRGGWVEAPYLACPADTRALAKSIVSVPDAGRPAAIVPGLSCVSPLGGPDVMRGEETQILGAITLTPDLAEGPHILCLPGTHTKWAVVEAGRVTRFITAPVGEIYALLRAHSTLGRPIAEDAASDQGFELGLARLRQAGALALPHLLFETRARRLVDDLPAADAAGLMSGLLIGADVAAALVWAHDITSFVLVGDPALTRLYRRALKVSGVAISVLDGDACVLAGLATLSGFRKERD